MMVPDVLRVARRRVLRAGRAARERLIIRGVYRRTLPYEPFTDGGRTRPHFLVTRYLQHCKDASLGDSTEAHFLDNSLRGTGFATFDAFYWDTQYTGFPAGDRALLEACRRSRPDAILLSSYEPGHPTMPRPETLRLLRQEWGIPLVGLWYDTCWDGFWGFLQPILDFVDLHVVVDNPAHTFRSDGNDTLLRERFLDLALPWDPAIYNNPGRERDIDVSFLGQVGGYRSARMPYIEHLMERNIPVYWSGYDKAQQRPLSKYVEVLTRSKVALNFSHSVNYHQLKGRVYEILLCGALLLESNNPQIERCFEPMRDYVGFDSPADMATKIEYFLAHESERQEIAARGQAKAERYCDGMTFWTTVQQALEARLGRPLRAPAA